MAYQITEDCVGCGACAKKCPEKAISGQPKSQHHIDPLFCVGCGACFNTCPRGAILDPYGRRSPKRGKKSSVKADIQSEICAACQTCLLHCPQQAIRVVRKGLLRGQRCQVNPERCIGCGACQKLCITGAVTLRDQHETDRS